MQDLMAISARKVAHIENHEILHTIGEGQFAKVKLAWNVLTKEVVAISRSLKREMRAPPGSRKKIKRLIA